MRSVSLLAALMLLLAIPARADVIRLKTGESVKGVAVQEESNENVIVVKDYLSGAVRVFSWDALDTEDRDQILEDWGWKNKAFQAIKGVRIVQRLDDGTLIDIEGILNKEDDQAYYIQTNGQELRVPKGQVVGKPEPEDVDPRAVWAPTQLWQMFLDEVKKEANVDLANPTPQLHWRLAEYAMQIEDWEDARTHYKACAEDKTFLKSEVAQQRLDRVEALIRAKVALDALRDIRLKLNMNLFAKVRTMLDEFPTKFPDAGADVTKELEKLKAKFAARRTDYFQKMARNEFVDVVEDMIAAKLKEKNEKNESPTITDVTSWARRELLTKAFENLATLMKKRDETVTADEARTFWDGRPKTSWRRVSYGSGTFIVNPAKIRPPKPHAPSSSGSSSSSKKQNGPQGKVEIPKPPTRDEWWTRVSPREKQNWVLAFFAENSELFEVGAREFKPCETCNGEGLQHKATQTGDVISFLCVRCGGAQNDVIVKFR